MLRERTRLYFKYLILRYKAEKRLSIQFSPEEIELLNFVKFNIRQSSSIIIDMDGGDSVIKITNGNIEFIMQKDRLMVVDSKSYMDVPTGEVVKREIIYYINKVMRYRLSVFNKKCKSQIHTLITNFK